MNEVLPCEANNVRNGVFFKNSIESEYLFYTALRSFNQHSEESYFIKNITFKEAIVMGSEYAPYAIFYLI